VEQPLDMHSLFLNRYSPVIKIIFAENHLSNNDVYKKNWQSPDKFSILFRWIREGICWLRYRENEDRENAAKKKEGHRKTAGRSRA